MITERDILIGLFSAVIAIGERLTGQTMTVTVTDQSGEAFGIGRSASVRWGEPTSLLAAAETHCDLPGEQRATRPT